MKSYQEKYEKCRELISELIMKRRELTATLAKERQLRENVRQDVAELRKFTKEAVDQLQFAIIEKNDRIDALTYRLSLYESQDIAKIRSTLKSELREELAAEIRAELSQDLRDSLQDAKTFIDRIYGL